MRYLASKFRRIIQGIVWHYLSPSIYRSAPSADGKLIGKPAQIGNFCLIDYGGNVTIGQNVKIGYGVFIISSSTITGSKNTRVLRKPIVIGDNVEIGSNSVILPGVAIGNNTTIVLVLGRL